VVAANHLSEWQETLFDPKSSASARATAIRGHLDRPSPWRQALLRHDQRLWALFPTECAEHQAGSSLADQPTCSHGAAATSMVGDTRHDCAASSVPQLQCMVADVSVQIAHLASVSPSSCLNVTSMEGMMKATGGLHAMMQRLNAAVERHRVLLHREWEYTSKQRQSTMQLESVVQQASTEVEAAFVRVQSAVASGRRADVEAAIRVRQNTATEAIESVHSALLDYQDQAMGALHPEPCSAVKQARVALDGLEHDKDTHGAIEPLVQVPPARCADTAKHNDDEGCLVPVFVRLSCVMFRG